MTATEGLLKADLAATEDRLKQDITALRSELSSTEDRFRADLAEMKSSIIQWMLGLFIATFGATLGIVFTVIGILHM